MIASGTVMSKIIFESEFIYREYQYLDSNAACKTNNTHLRTTEPAVRETVSGKVVLGEWV